jgi:hypothetical protein
MTPQGVDAENIFIDKHGEWAKVINTVGIWGVGTVKDFIVFYEWMESTGVTIDDVKDWVKIGDAEQRGRIDIKRKQISEFMNFSNQRFSCPECGFHIGFEEVNTHPGMMVGGNYTYVIYCANHIEGCEWSKYIKGTIQDWVRNEKKLRADALKNIHREVKNSQPGGIVRKHDRLKEAEIRVHKKAMQLQREKKDGE